MATIPCRRRKSNAPEGPAKSPEPEPFSLRDVGLELAVVGVAFSMSPSVALYVPLVKSGKSVGKQPYISEGVCKSCVFPPPGAPHMGSRNLSKPELRRRLRIRQSQQLHFVRPLIPFQQIRMTR